MSFFTFYLLFAGLAAVMCFALIRADGEMKISDLLLALFVTFMPVLNVCAVIGIGITAMCEALKEKKFFDLVLWKKKEEDVS